MSEMIERVALAIWEGLQSKPPMLSRESVIAAAEHAIAALREPTEVMVSAAWLCIEVNDPGFHQMRDALRAAIDEALK